MHPKWQNCSFDSDAQTAQLGFPLTGRDACVEGQEVKGTRWWGRRFFERFLNYLSHLAPSLLLAPFLYKLWNAAASCRFLFWYFHVMPTNSVKVAACWVSSSGRACPSGRLRGSVRELEYVRGGIWAGFSQSFCPACPVQISASSLGRQSCQRAGWWLAGLWWKYQERSHSLPRHEVAESHGVGSVV